MEGHEGKLINDLTTILETDIRNRK